MDELFGFYPHLTRQGQKAKKKAEERKVQTLPDPKTYAFVSGLLGEEPDAVAKQFQESILEPHPQKQALQGAAEKGYALSLLSSILPITKGLPVGASIKNVGKSAINEADVLAKFGQKAAREARIAKRVSLLDDAANAPSVTVKKVPKAARTKVDPDFLRQMQAAEGEDAVLKAVRKGAHLKPDGKGGYVGAPRHITNPQALGRLRQELDWQFDDAAEAVTWADPERAGTWYDRAKATQAATNEPWQLPRSLDQHAVYSAGVSPESELAFALKHANSRALGMNEMAYRGAGMKKLDNAVKADKAPKLADKISEYRVKNDPNVPNEGLFGVNDFRAAQNFGYTEPGGVPTKKVTGTMHPFMDGETALAVDRARANQIGGRTDWQGSHVQEIPWVYGKAQDIYARGSKGTGRFVGAGGQKAALVEANNTIADYLPKHTASATHEAIPGKSTGHVPSILDADEATKQAYANTGRWDVPSAERSLLEGPVGEGNRDALYSAVGFRQLPSLQASGAYTNSVGQLETNPMTIARPLLDFPTGGGGGRVADTRAATMNAIERFRAVNDGQEAWAWNLPNTLQAPTGKNSLLLESQSLPNAQQLSAMTGLLDDTGYGVTATNRGALVFPFDPGAKPKDLQAMMKKSSAGLLDAYPSNPQKAVTSSGYGPGVGKWGDDGIVPTTPYSGEATIGLLEEMAQAPAEVARKVSEDEGVRQILRQKIARDAALPGARGDIQNTRNLFAEGDWNKIVELIRRGVPPAAALAALGYSANTLAEER